MAHKHKLEEDDDEFGDLLEEEGQKDDMQWYAQQEISKIVDFRQWRYNQHQ